MPPLSSLALRYLAWLIGLRVLYALGVAFLGLPQMMATDVILAAAPMIDIASQVARRATREISISDWAMIWGICLAIFAVLMVIGPLAIAMSGGADIAAPTVMRTNLAVVFATGIMMALFLLIGARIKR